jgi:hypothetical protein
VDFLEDEEIKVNNFKNMSIKNNDKCFKATYVFNSTEK